MKGPTQEVTQTDLENILAIKTQIWRYREMLDRMSARVLTQLEAGAPIEDGRRTVEISETCSGGRRTQRLVVR